MRFRAVILLVVTLVLSSQFAQLAIGQRPGGASGAGRGAGSTNSPQSPQKPSGEDQAVELKTQLIELRAVVTDKQGRLIDGLTRQDFELLENDKRQEVSFFSVEHVGEKSSAPPPAAEARPATANAIIAAKRPPAEPIGRTVILFVDSLHLSDESFVLAKRSLKKFIDERMTDIDLGCVVSTNTNLGLFGQLTKDKRILRQAIDRIGPGPSADRSFFTPYLASLVEHGDLDAINAAVSIMMTEDNITGNALLLKKLAQDKAKYILSEAINRSQSTLETLQAVADKLSETPGQRILVLLSDGFTLLDRGGGHNTTGVNAAVSRAVRSGAVIYTIDMKGLQTPSVFSASRPGSLPPQAQSRILGYQRSAEYDLQDSMNALARDTGGEALFDTNDINASLSKAVDNNRLYYVLDYYPADDSNLNKARTIKVRVKDHPEYTIRAQNRYVPADLAKRQQVVAAESPHKQMVLAMAAPLPVTTIGIAAQADYLEIGADPDQVSLSVDIDGATLDYQPTSLMPGFQLELEAIFYNAEGKAVKSFIKEMKADLSPERIAVAKRNCISYAERVGLPPGVYQVRVGVRDTAGERMGTASAWVTVPDLKHSGLTASGILLLDSGGHVNPFSTAVINSETAQSRSVDGTRFYQQGSNLLYQLVVYNPKGKTPDSTDTMMQVEIAQDEKVISQSQWHTLSNYLLRTDPKGFQVGGQIKLQGLPPGLYDLKVSFRDGKDKKPQVQTTQFGIEK